MGYGHLVRVAFGATASMSSFGVGHGDCGSSVRTLALTACAFIKELVGVGSIRREGGGTSVLTTTSCPTTGDLAAARSDLLGFVLEGSIRTLIRVIKKEDLLLQDALNQLDRAHDARAGLRAVGS